MKRPTVPNKLWHYTCREHGKPGIRRDGLVLPHRHPLIGVHLAWFTDLDRPDIWALGLSRMTLCCDRTQVRCSVVAGESGFTSIVPWWWWARRNASILPPSLRDILEDPGAPTHWYVSPQPVSVTDITDTSVLMGHAEMRAQA